MSGIARPHDIPTFDVSWFFEYDDQDTLLTNKS